MEQRMRRGARQRAALRERNRLAGELGGALEAIRRNEAAFEEAVDGYVVEQIIYEHAALMCRCRAVLRDLRGGDGACPLP